MKTEGVYSIIEALSDENKDVRLTCDGKRMTAHNRNMCGKILFTVYGRKRGSSKTTVLIETEVVEEAVECLLKD